ncbi:hypothetical protein [Actinomadura sp. CNU-125]|uniref:hypothetical protein n=1 Tax=Actinomadura sp. CNU-125 TaxID=1904961 RepID=UPI000AB5DE3A|nr:hypothetical protein [Actinomadura sp. CNU-125]
MEDIDAIALLQDPVRRRLYEFVAGLGREVGRNEAAEAVGVGRTLAAFHLDKLADAGLLEAGSRRLSGRSGPGAGRPAKVYRRSAAERGVSVPARDYGTAAGLLAEAAERRARTRSCGTRRGGGGVRWRRRAGRAVVWRSSRRCWRGAVTSRCAKIASRTVRAGGAGTGRWCGCAIARSTRSRRRFRRWCAA